MPGLTPPKDRLLHEQVRLLVRNVPAPVVGTLVLATGAAALLVRNGHGRAQGDAQQNPAVLHTMLSNLLSNWDTRRRWLRARK